MLYRVAVLTNFLPPYFIPLFEALTSKVDKLRVFTSVRMEPDRSWPVFEGNFETTVLRSLSWTHNFKHLHGYRDKSHIHIPYNTLTKLMEYRPDVVITSEFGARTLLSLGYKLCFRKTKFIVWANLSERTEATRGLLRIALRKLILRYADAAFTNGSSGAEYLKRLGYSGQLFTIPYVTQGVKGTVHGHPPDGCLHLFCASQLIERKGLAPFLEVLCRWCANHPQRRLKLQIAGGGPQRNELASIPLPQNLQVTFLGDVRVDDLPTYYQDASIFVFPTLGDEWGVVVNEALSAGLPVLGSIHSQAAQELIQSGVNGWLFDPVDFSDTYDAMTHAFTTDEGTLQQYAQNAITSIAGLTPENMATRMVQAIESLYGGQK